MKQILLLLGLTTLLSSCLIQIDLQKRDLPIREEDLPYKQYLMLGNTCVAADGALATVMLRKASNNSPGGSAPTYPWLERYEVVVVKTSLSGQMLWEVLAYTSVSMVEQRPLIHPLSDGGYLVYTVTHDMFPYPKDPQMTPLVLRLDAQGKVLEKRQAQLPYYPTAFTPDRILSVPNDGFAVVGRLFNQNMGNPLLLLRFSEQGHLQWYHTYTTSAYIHTPIGLTTTPDGGFLLSYQGNGTDEDYDQSFLLRTDASGVQLWHRRYSVFAARHVSPRPEGGYLLQATQSPVATHTLQYTMSENGDLLSVRQYPLPEGQNYITPLGIFPSAHAITSAYAANQGDIYFLVTDLSGQAITHNRVHGPQFMGSWVEVLPLPDGSFCFTGRDGYGTFGLARAQTEGTLLWSIPIPAQK